MFPKKYIRYGAMAILAFMALVVFIGCSNRLQPKAWMSVEKAPMRVIIVDNEKDISPQTIHMVIDQLKIIPYRDYQFNSQTGVSVMTDHSAVKEDHSSSSLEVSNGR